MNAKQNSLVDNAADVPQDGVATETMSDLAPYEPSPVVVEELRRRITAVKAGDVISFQDYVEQVRERRKKFG